jgi:Flp pilus assembly protein TadG
MNKASKIISGIVILLVVGGGSFYGGMLYGKSQSAASAASARASFTSRGGRTIAAGAGFTTGTIIAEDSSSITLALPTGSGSKIIFYSTATTISKTASGTSSDLTTGTSVSVTGTANSDGSVTAQSIQIRPAGQVRPTTVPPAQ